MLVISLNSQFCKFINIKAKTALWMGNINNLANNFMRINLDSHRGKTTWWKIFPPRLAENFQRALRIKFLVLTCVKP